MREMAIVVSAGMILQYTKLKGNHCQVATPVLGCTKTFAVFPGQENRMAISYCH